MTLTDLPNADISCSNPNIADIEFSKEDIESAIDEIDRDAATTENDIPANIPYHIPST